MGSLKVSTWTPASTRNNISGVSTFSKMNTILGLTMCTEAWERAATELRIPFKFKFSFIVVEKRCARTLFHD